MTGSAADMIARCFRHQTPEAFGRPEVPAVIVPTELRYGRDDVIYPQTPTIPEESMGDPDVVSVETVAP